MERAYYHETIEQFLMRPDSEILGKLASNNQFDLLIQQKNAWEDQICLLKKVLADYKSGYIAFEYTIPRIGSRIDVVLIVENCLILLEFKNGESNFTKADADQVVDYALDLKYFHEKSADVSIFPVIVATNANCRSNNISLLKEGIYKPIHCNSNSLRFEIEQIIKIQIDSNKIDGVDWMQSEYRPSPTIVEAAQALYSGHSVSEISRHLQRVRHDFAL